jgi:hypothetical protein
LIDRRGEGGNEKCGEPDHARRTIGKRTEAGAEQGRPNRRGLIADRDETHGSFDITATTAQQLEALVRASPHWINLTLVQREALDGIAVKVARILSGNPNCRDHWADIAGYAWLGLNGG